MQLSVMDRIILVSHQVLNKLIVVKSIGLLVVDTCNNSKLMFFIQLFQRKRDAIPCKVRVDPQALTQVRLVVTCIGYSEGV